MGKHDRSTIRDTRKPGWFYVDNAIIDRYGSQVGAIGIAVYAALARHANRDTGQAFPAYKTLSTNLDLSKNTVIAAIKRLQKAGLITVEQQTDQAGNPINTNIYTLCSIADTKGESVQWGGAADEPPRVQEMNPPMQQMNPGGAADERGGSNAAYEHEYHIERDHESPPPSAQQKNGGGGDFYEQEIRSLLSSYGIMAARKIAHQYAERQPRCDLETIRASIDAISDPSEPHNLSRIARRLEDSPPPPGQPYQKVARATLAERPAPPPAPRAGLTPERLKELKELNDYKRQL